MMQTRPPTGVAPWPMILLAGAEKAGKSWAAAEASGHESIRDTYWLSIGEDQPDEYANVPGARFQIVEHDGAWQSILNAIREAAALPQGDKPDLLIVDSMGRLWAQLSDIAQAEANERAAAKARKYNRAEPEDDVSIGMDLWNRAKTRWSMILDALREFPGPVILTARLSVVTVMNGEGKPTAQKTDKIEAEKNLAFDVGAVVKMPERGTAILSGVRSTKLQLDKPTKLDSFSVARLWEAMGVDGGPRTHAAMPVEHRQEAPVEHSEGTIAQWEARIRAVTDKGGLSTVWSAAVQEGMADALREIFAEHGATL